MVRKTRNIGPLVVNTCVCYWDVSFVSPSLIWCLFGVGSSRVGCFVCFMFVYSLTLVLFALVGFLTFCYVFVYFDVFLFLTRWLFVSSCLFRVCLFICLVLVRFVFCLLLCSLTFVYFSGMVGMVTFGPK